MSFKLPKPSDYDDNGTELGELPSDSTPDKNKAADEALVAEAAPVAAEAKRRKQLYEPDILFDPNAMNQTYKYALDSLKIRITKFIEQSDDNGDMKAGQNINIFIENLLLIWMLFNAFNEKSIGEICYDAFKRETPPEFQPYLPPGKFVDLIIKALTNSMDTPHRTYLKNVQYEETVHDFLLDYFLQNYNTFFTEGGSVDKKLLKAIVGFKVTQKKDNDKKRYKNLGFVEIHTGVWTPYGRGEYCEEIKKICEQLDGLGIRFLVSDNVNKNCYDGRFTPKTYNLASRFAVTTTSAGGSSFRRRKVYKPSRISRKPRKSHKTRRTNKTKSKTKKQYRRKRYTKRCKKSHRRSRH